MKDKIFSFLVAVNSKQASVTSWQTALLSMFRNAFVLYVSMVLSSIPSTLNEEENATLAQPPLWGIIPSWIHRVMFYPITLGAEHYSYMTIIVLSSVFLALELFTLFMYAVFYLLHSRGNKYCDKIKRILIQPLSLFMLVFTTWMVWIHCVPMSSSSSSSSSHTISNEYFPSITMNSTLNTAFIVIGCVGVILNMILVSLGVLVMEETVPPTRTSLSLFGMFSPNVGVCIHLLNQTCVVLNVLLHVNQAISASAVKCFLSFLVAVYFLYGLPYYKTFINSLVFGCLCGKTLGCLGPIMASALMRNIIQQQEQQQEYISQLGGIITGVTIALQALGFVLGTLSCELYLRFGVLNAVKRFMTHHLTDKHSAIQIYNTFQENKSMRKLILFLRLSISDAFSSKQDNALEWALQFLKLCGTSKSITNVDFLLISAIITSFYSTQEELYSSHSLALSMLFHAKKNNPSLVQSYFIVLRSKEIEANVEKFSMINVDLKQTLQSLQKKQQAMTYFHKELFKELISENCSKKKIENLNRSSTILVQECDTLYKSLMLKYRSDTSLLRSTLIPIKQQDETVLPLYENATTSISAFVDHILNQGDDIAHVKSEQHPQLIMSMCIFMSFLIVGTVCMIWSYSSLSAYWNEEHHLRRMLNYLHWEIIDQNDQLKQFVLNHKIPNLFIEPSRKFTTTITENYFRNVSCQKCIF